jgi:hypothetical protein
VSPFSTRLFGALAVASAVFSGNVSFAQSQQHYYVANVAPPDDYLALRSLPSSSQGLRIAIMTNGTLVDVLEQRSDGWWRVRIYSSGVEGWALSGAAQRQWIVCCQIASQGQQPIDSLIAFRTPSDNIHCLASSSDGYLRCDLKVIENPRLGTSEPCDLSSGDAFGISADGAIGEVVCHGDTVIQEGSHVLQYGQVWRGLGFTCQSGEAGLTCSNDEKHGFFISRTAQRLF